MNAGIVLVAIGAVIVLIAGGSSNAQKSADAIDGSTPETSESRATLLKSISDTGADIVWILAACAMIVCALCCLFGVVPGLLTSAGIWTLIKLKVLS